MKDEKVTLTKEEHAKFFAQLRELEAFREKFLRTAADYDNARKRLAKEREEFLKFSQEKLIRDLLPILDNFERALTHSESGDKAVLAGVQLVSKQLLEMLARHGLKRLPSEGQPFDPRLHEAVERVEEKGPEGVIVKEITPGYQLHDRILRPAKVRIRVSPQGEAGPVTEKEEELT